MHIEIDLRKKKTEGRFKHLIIGSEVGHGYLPGGKITLKERTSAIATR